MEGMKWVNEWDRRLEYHDEHWLYFEGRPLYGLLYDLHDNGTFRYQEEYVAGRPTGVATYWYPDGKMSAETKIVDGITESREWFENGQLEKENIYHPGDVSVAEREWNENGILISEYLSFPGNFYGKNGTLRKFSHDGKPILVEEYKLGQLIKTESDL